MSVATDEDRLDETFAALGRPEDAPVAELGGALRAQKKPTQGPRPDGGGLPPAT